MLKSLQTYSSLLIILLLWGCVQQKPLEPQMPEVLLTEQQMVDVLTDMQLADALLAVKPKSDDSAKVYIKTYHEYIYNKHGIDEALFKANFNYYKLLPVQIDSIYAKVIVALSKMESEQSGLQTVITTDTSNVGVITQPISEKQVKSNKF